MRIRIDRESNKCKIHKKDVYTFNFNRPLNLIDSWQPKAVLVSGAVCLTAFYQSDSQVSKSFF